MLYHNKILEPLVDLSKNDPSFVVFSTGKSSISAKALLTKSNILATVLLKNSFKEGDVALLVIKPGIDFLVVFYSLMMLRAKIAIIDPEMGRDNYYAKMRQLSPKWLFADSRLLLISYNTVLSNLINIFSVLSD